MPISQAMYESREQFMLEALEIQADIQAFLQERGFGGRGGRGGGFGRGGGAPDTPEGRLQAAARDVGGAYGALNGNGVRPGSLYPPTQAMREALTRAKNMLGEMRGGMR
jgi:hypothetical protein